MTTRPAAAAWTKAHAVLIDTLRPVVPSELFQGRVSRAIFRQYEGGLPIIHPTILQILAPTIGAAGALAMIGVARGGGLCAQGLANRAQAVEHPTGRMEIARQ